MWGAMRERETDGELVPIVRAAGELAVGYLAARNAALKGELELHWKGRHMLVTRASIEHLKAKRAADEALEEHANAKRDFEEHARRIRPSPPGAA